MHDFPNHLRHLFSCPPEEAPTALRIFADWLDEQRDARCEVLRKLVARGPVEVEPVRPELIRRRDMVSDSPLPFVGYWPVNDGDCTPFCPYCNYTVALGLPGVGSTWRQGHCTKCWERCWALNMTREDATREFLHRLRVSALILFRDEMLGMDSEVVHCHFGDESHKRLPGLHVDHRWPPNTCAICEATMCRCERCRAEWCLDHQPQPLKCPECGDCPSDRTSTLTVNGQTFQVTDWQVGWDTEADDVFGPPDAAEPDHEVHRRPSYLQRQDYQPPPSRGRAYTADDRRAFKKRVEKRRKKK